MITFNNTKTLYDLVKNVGKEYENRVFFRFERDDMIFEKGYGTFTIDTMAIAHYIHSQNEKMGHPVHAALLGKCSYEYLTVLMGAPAGGGVSIPLDSQLSEEKMIENLKKADTDILFYDRNFASQADYIMERCPFIKKSICLQSRKNVRCATLIQKVHRGETFKFSAKPEDCAMIIFTSGTTGRGKGVMLSHANIIDNMFCTDDDTEICLNVLPINHVFCISGDVMLVLRYGSTLCLCDDLTKIMYYIQLFQPTVMRVVPMMAKMLINRIGALQAKNPDMPISEVKQQVLGKRLNRLVSGGGYLSEALSSALLNLGIVTGQGYGMSECSPKISIPDYERKDKVASVGKLVTGCKVRIVNGEIQVSSPSVMMGYYNDPELTKEAITEDGWLCTGDLGYLDDENFLYLNGRKKNLIILSNGENVSPEMIENLFDGDPLVGELIAFGQDDIIAVEVYPNYEYAQENDILDIQAELNKIVAKHNAELPPYAQIADCKLRTTPFAKTTSKKIIRETFFEKKNAKKAKAAAYKLPATELQKQIYDIVVRAVGGNEFGVEDNLYTCGLDSLGSTMVIADFAEELNCNITLAELMDNTSILDLEKLITAKANEERMDLSVREVYPLTAIQKYFAYIIPGNTTGNLPFAFRLSKDIDLYRLKDAIYTVLDAHPALKAIVKPTEQKYYAIFRDDSRVIDIPITPIRDEEAEQKMQELIKPFRYRADDDLVHIGLFQGEKYCYMFFDLAHFMGDGVTMNIIMEDLRKAYDGEEIEAEKYTAYDYILEESMRESNGIRQRDIQYVDGLLKGAKLQRSILNRVDAQDLSHGEYAVIKKRFNTVARKHVLYYGKQNGVSENAMFIAAFNYCISLFSDEKDVFSNSIHSGRTDSRWNRITGPLFETYYSRYTVEAHETVDKYIRRTGKQIMNTMKCLTNCPRQGEMFFQFQGDILEVPQIGGAAERIHVQLDSLPFHMQVMFDKKGYYVELRYWENRFDKASLEVFLTCFEAVLKAMFDETSVRCLKDHMPKEVYPTHFFLEAGKLNEAAGHRILKYAENDEKVKVYVFDENYNRKPYGAWGPVYIMNYEPVNYTESVQYPYEPGMLYGTGLIGRIMPDGTIDFLHESGRTVAIEGLRGRLYYDLKAAEETLLDMFEVSKAHFYMEYNPEINEMSLAVDIKTNSDLTEDMIRNYMKQEAGELLVPKFVHFIA